MSGVKKRILENINQVALKKHRVNLSIMDDIEEEINRGFGLEEFIEEEIDKAAEAAIKARDIIRFDLRDAYINAEALVEEFEQEVNELGLDNPPELQKFRQELSDLEQFINKIEMDYRDRTGYQI